MNRLLRAAAGALLLGMAIEARPADPAPRCAPESAQFDFWVGTWTVTERGKPAGTNRIERVLGGCALMESWQGASGSAGRSLNFYDAADGRWHQTWIDSSGGALFLSGRLTNGSMRLEGERPAEGKDPPMRHRITWTALPDGKLRQLWESRAAGSREWVVQFDGIYEPAK
jgi:hypothetical protein